MHNVPIKYAFNISFILCLFQSEEKEQTKNHTLGLVTGLALCVVFAVVSAGLAVKFKLELRRLKTRKNGRQTHNRPLDL